MQLDRAQQRGAAYPTGWWHLNGAPLETGRVSGWLQGRNGAMGYYGLSETLEISRSRYQRLRASASSSRQRQRQANKRQATSNQRNPLSGVSAFDFS